MDNIKKVAFMNFWPTFDAEENFLVNPLKKLYKVQVVKPQEADYVFCSVQGKDHFFVADDKIKIQFTLENICPDFNACDYAIGFEFLKYGDRYYRLPGYMTNDYISDVEKAEAKHLLPSDFSVAKEKTKFCSYTISNGNRASADFLKLVDLLEKYKRVDSGGRWHNNIGGPVSDKLAFDCEHKFTIVFENSSHPGYTTEKLIQAFAAKTVPIYWGDPTISDYFNTKAFINIRDYNSISEVVDEIIKIDNNDELFMSYLKQPIYKDNQPTSTTYRRDLQCFLKNILDQPKESAKRRNRVYFGAYAIEDGRKLAMSNTLKGAAKLFLIQLLGKRFLSVYADRKRNKKGNKKCF